MLTYTDVISCHSVTIVADILYSVIIIVTCYVNLSTIAYWIRQSTSHPLTEGTDCINNCEFSKYMQCHAMVCFGLLPGIVSHAAAATSLLEKLMAFRTGSGRLGTCWWIRKSKIKKYQRFLILSYRPTSAP